MNPLYYEIFPSKKNESEYSSLLSLLRHGDFRFFSSLETLKGTCSYSTEYNGSTKTESAIEFFFSS